jgi:hypothetical protein
VHEGCVSEGTLSVRMRSSRRPASTWSSVTALPRLDARLISRCGAIERFFQSVGAYKKNTGTRIS